MDSLQAWVTLIKDIVTGLAALVAAYVGFTGLQAWKKQLTANAEYALAKRVLTAVYKIRNSVEEYRLTYFEGRDAKPFHEKLLPSIENAQLALEVEMLEIEAVWGEDENFKVSLGMFQDLIRELKLAHSVHYADGDDGDFTAFFYEVFNPNPKERIRSIIFTENFHSRDEFSTKLHKAVEQVEDFLRPKLTLKQGKIRLWHRFKKSRL